MTNTLTLIIAILNLILLALIAYSFSHTRTSSRDSHDDFIRLEEKLRNIEGRIDRLSPTIEQEFRNNRSELGKSFERIESTIDRRVERLQNDNNRKLDQMRETVDEKLQSTVEKRFAASFSTISKQLAEVHDGLGEMKSLATGVGDLRKVMEGVKTRGIYGEVQLGAIIEDTLSSSQYARNIITKKGTSDRVEFAVKMPGKEETVYLPIDSKFPVENYSRLIAAYDSGTKEDIGKYQKALADDVKTQAKKISSKYIDPPFTTDFAMMFVPTESLYAEILRIPGLEDDIRQKYNITISSPSTLPVILSGLLMGFRTVAIEKRSAEVWQILGAVKTQFSKFGDTLEAVEKKLHESATKIEQARTSSRQIEKRLKDVETLPESHSDKLLGV